MPELEGAISPRLPDPPTFKVKRVIKNNRLSMPVTFSTRFFCDRKVPPSKTQLKSLNATAMKINSEAYCSVPWKFDENLELFRPEEKG